MPAIPAANMSAEPAIKPNVVVAESKASMMSNIDPILTDLSVPLVNRIVERTDAKSKADVAAIQSKNALLFKCPIRISAVAIPLEPISSSIG
jgi:hypothetical protein